MTMLTESEIKNMNKPNPIAIHSKNVKRGSTGAIRKALSVSLSTQTPLGISFVGGSLPEIIMDKKLKDRVAATMNIVKIQEMLTLTPYIQKMERKDGEEVAPSRELHSGRHRMETCLRLNRNEATKSWYSMKLHKFNEK